MTSILWMVVRFIFYLVMSYNAGKAFVAGILHRDPVVSGIGAMSWCIMLVMIRWFG